MPTRAAAAALLGAGAGSEEEEEEEDEPLALPVPAAAAGASSAPWGGKRPAAEEAEGGDEGGGVRQPDVKRARGGKARSTDVGELQAALAEAEARIEGFQVCMHGCFVWGLCDGHEGLHR